MIKRILICDICHLKTRHNMIMEKHKLLFLLLFCSFSFGKWVVKYEQEFSSDVICENCLISFKEWLKERKEGKKFWVKK